MGWVEDNTNKDPMAKVGMRIRMLSMNDEEHPVDQGLEGVITHIDGLGTIHVRWDDGRALGVIPGLDEYQILPPEDEQVGPDDFEGLFEDSDPKPVLTGAKSTKAGKNVTKNFKSGLSKYRPKPKIKVEAENIKGGEAENMTPSDLAKKHGVKLKDIEKEIEVGVKIEMEHTDSKEKAKEIAMDHIAEFPDFYTNKKYGTIASEKGLEKVNEDKSTYTIKDDVERILKTIKTAKPQHKETILKMISNLEKKYQKKYGEKEKFVELIGTLREKVGEKFDIDETTTTGALGSSPIQPLGVDINRGKLSKTVSSDVVTKGNLKNPTGTVYTIKPKTESRIVKASDLLSEIASTDAIKLRDGGSYDGDSWVGDKGGWKRRKELAWKGGKISDILAKLDIDWTDSDLSLTDKETDKINNINEAKKDKDIHTAKWKRCFEKVSKEKGDEAAAGICTDSIGYEGSIKKSHRKKDKEEIEETTTFSSVWGANGPPVTPAFAAKKGKHGPSKKPIWKGGKIVQKIESDGILVNEVNTIKWVKGGKFVKIKDKCAKFNNQPWCDAGNASDPLELSDTTFENVKRVSEKTGLSEQEILERINIFKNGK